MDSHKKKREKCLRQSRRCPWKAPKWNEATGEAAIEQLEKRRTDNLGHSGYSPRMIYLLEIVMHYVDSGVK